MKQNSKILKEWRVLHSAISERINNALNNKGNLRDSLENYDYLNLALITNGESLINANLSNTAWETAKATGIISEFDFETTQMFTGVYELQKIITDKTLMKIVDLVFSVYEFNNTEIKVSLTQLSLLFQELIGQEYLLEHFYKTILETKPIKD